MKVTPVPGEKERFWVQSASREEIQHLVDLAYQETEADKPEPKCSCEQNSLKGLSCRHIDAVIRFAGQPNPSNE